MNPMRLTALALLGFLASAIAAACSPEERPFNATTSAATGTGGDTSSTTGAGGTGGTGGAEPVTADAACLAYAQSICKNADACTAYHRDLFYGDDATCIARYQLFCAAILNVPETAWTPEAMVACADATANLDCQGYIASLGGTLPEACKAPVGPRPDGAPCFEAAQCETAYCRKDFGAICGTCVYRAGEGEPCGVAFDCKEGLSCPSGTCVPVASLGGSCAQGQIDCAYGLVCRGGACSTPWDAEGTPCDPSLFGDCEGFLGLYCDAQTAACKTAVLVGAGDPCGNVAGTLHQCRAAGFCDTTKDPVVCVEVAQEGEACNLMTGPLCMLPAGCNGVCAVPSADACP